VKKPRIDPIALFWSLTMFRRFVSSSVGVLALLGVTGIPGHLHAQVARGNLRQVPVFSPAARQMVVLQMVIPQNQMVIPQTGQFTPGFDRRFLDPRFRGFSPGFDPFLNPGINSFSPGFNPFLTPGINGFSPGINVPFVDPRIDEFRPGFDRRRFMELR
jgi:hypothetical protein